MLKLILIREVIAQGRMPTLNNTKVVNGGEHMNVEIKKIDSDYMNQSENKLGKYILQVAIRVAMN